MLGKDVSNEFRHYGGDAPLDGIFMNIYFEELKNLSHLFSFSLILHPRILDEYESVFYEGWGSFGKIKFDRNDVEKNTKIDKIREFIKNPISLPDIVKKSLGHIHHEFIFKEPVKLKDNLLAVVCNSCSDEIIGKIRVALKNGKYDGVKIITKNYPFPSIDELM